MKDLAALEETIKKLIYVSFDNPSKNYRVMKFCNKALEEIKFFKNEKYKLFQELGVIDGDAMKILPENEEKFKNKVSELLEFEVSEIPELGIDIDDLINCKYSKDEENWLNAMDMYCIEELIKNEKKQADS